MISVGIDTSNYTTSIAYFDGVASLEAGGGWAASVRCGFFSHEKPAGAFRQAVFPFLGEGH